MVEAVDIYSNDGNVMRGAEEEKDKKHLQENIVKF